MNIGRLWRRLIDPDVRYIARTERERAERRRSELAVTAKRDAERAEANWQRFTALVAPLSASFRYWSAPSSGIGVHGYGLRGRDEHINYGSTSYKRDPKGIRVSYSVVSTIVAVVSVSRAAELLAQQIGRRDQYADLNAHEWNRNWM